MKTIFYLGLLVFIAYEFLNNYFVMGYPGSQKLDSLVVSHALSYYKVYFEIIIILIIFVSGKHVYKRGGRVFPVIMILLSILLYGYFNFIFTAENKFRKPQKLILATVNTNQVDKSMMIVGIEFNGESKAYPVDYIRYHHRIVDSIGGKVVFVTYCGLCRTGRVYEPFIEGKYTSFRLVGINHHNAMFEDEPTKSWWSQETGNCIVGKLKGTRLAEVQSQNMTLQRWIELFPATKIMQPDPMRGKYGNVNDYLENIENPKTPQKGGTWSAHSYVIGISENNNSKAYEWNYLIEKRIIQDRIGDTHFILVISIDNKSFAAFERTADVSCNFRNDTLFLNGIPFNLAGTNLNTSKMELKKVNAYREYWFSWLHAHPNTTRVNL